ncbi:hypothetical protein BSKO_01181 [Bryopsis sp. KO-2023]|nr:hypothetical protein BSKO_01181 [Bryopsis sp. KO-2023]
MVAVVTVRDVCTQWGGAAKDSARDYLKIISVKEVRRSEDPESETVYSTDSVEREKMNRKGRYNRPAVDDTVSDSDLEGPRSAASEDDLSLQSEESVVEQGSDPLSAAIKLNFPEVKDEIRVTAKGDFLKTVDYGVHVFQHQGKVAVVLRGLGSAIQRTVDIANAIQRRIPILQMASNIGSTHQIYDERSSLPPRPLVSFISIMLKVDSPLPVAPRPVRQRRPANWHNRRATPSSGISEGESKKVSPRLPNPDAHEKKGMKEPGSLTPSSDSSKPRSKAEVKSETAPRTRRGPPMITAVDANLSELVRPDRPRSASVPRPGHGRTTKGRGGFNSQRTSGHKKKTDRSGVLQDRRNLNCA